MDKDAVGDLDAFLNVLEIVQKKITEEFSELRRAGYDLREQEERLRALIEALGQGQPSP